MNERSDRLMKALGDIGADLIAKAAPVFPEAPDTSEHGNIIAVTPCEPEIQLTKRDIRIYWITRILGAAAAIAIIGTGVFLLWKNWDKIAVREPDRPGVITTVSEPVVTSDSAITEPDKYDPFLYYSDMDMPEPFAQPEITEFYYGGTDGWHDEFYNLWKNDFYMIDDYLQKYVGEERAMEVISGYKAEQLADNQAGNITRYRIDDTQNWYRFAMDTGLTANDVRRARQMADENWSESPASMVQEDIFVTFGSKEKIAENNKTEYCISVGEYVFSPRWLYYHTTEDYKAAGITPRMINDMLEKYKTLGLTDEAWAAFSAKLQEYADTVDHFGQITDTSMPLPFEHYDSRYNSIFHDLWINKFTTISNKLLELSDNDKDLELMNKLSETRCETPYTLDGNDGIMNLYWWMKELDVSVDEVCRAIEKNNEYYRTREDFNDIIYTIEELAAIQSGNRKTIAETFASEYCIIVGENVFSPKWLYYHTIEDYKAAGIPTAELNHKMSSYKELGLTDEAWSAFKVKLSTYVNSSYGADTLAVNIADNGYSFSEKTFGIFEDVFYGEWKPAEGNNADQNIILTYSKDMFTFENWIYPFGIIENDEAYVMPYMSGGVPECLIIRKNDPRVLYKGWWNRTDSSDYYTESTETFTVDPGTGKYKRINDEPYDRELHTGEIGVWGLLRLIVGGEQSNIRPKFETETYYTIPGGFYGGGNSIPGGFDGKGHFTDENGTEWVISGTKALGASKVYYLGGDGITSLTLGIRYYEKAAYETYINEHIDDAAYEPKEQYFAVSFTVDENGICRTTYRPLEEVYEEAKTKTYTGATPDYYEGLLPELELKDVLRVGESLSFQSAVVALRAPDGEIKASCPLASGMVGLSGYSCTAMREPLVQLFNLENRRILIAVGLPLWESEFDRSYLTSFYLYDGDPILRRVEADGDCLEVIVKDSAGISPGEDGTIYCTQPDGLILEYHIGENGHAALSPSQYN